MNLFGNLTTAGLEETTDNLGGVQTRETDIYTGIIKMAYAGSAKSGARFIGIVFEEGGKEYRETVYITNKNGENFFLNKNDPTKKVPLPGFTLIDDICMCATGKPLAEQDAEDKVIKLYDFEAKKELPTSVPVLIELLGKEVSLAIVKAIENKQAKNASGEYEPTAETREVNFIDKAFNTETKKTVVEARNGLEEAVFWDSWLEKNKGKVRDKTSKNVPKPGMPGAAASSSSPAPRKSIFGSK